MRKYGTAAVCALTALALLLGGCSAKGKKEWYRDALSEAASQGTYSFFRLLDIDGDGTEELFLSTTGKAFVGSEDKAELLVSGGKKGPGTVLQEIGGAGGEEWFYEPGEKMLVYSWRLSGERHLVLYHLKDGSLKEDGSADYYAPNHGPAGGKDPLWTVNGEEVPEETAQAVWDKYAAEETAVDFVPLDSVKQ